MGPTVVSRVVRSSYNAAFRPARFVRVNHEALHGSLLTKIDQLASLVGIFVTNLIMYALPLTLAGLGTVPNVQNSPLTQITGSPEIAQFVLRFAQNSLYLTGAAGVTFAAFHAGVLLTKSSRGILPSLHTVTYSTSGYLAVIFTFVLYLSTAERFTRAAELVLWFQLTFVYEIIDLVGVDLVIQGAGRPSSSPPYGLSAAGQLLVAGLIIACLYYVYSIYLGSRINHGTSRTTAALTVLAVLSTPILFVIGSIVAVTTVGI